MKRELSDYKTIEKAKIALDVLEKYDEQNSDIGIKQVLREIVNRWRDLN